MMHEARFGAEREPPHARMQPVCTDYQVEPTRGGMLECDLDGSELAGNG